MLLFTCKLQSQVGSDAPGVVIAPLPAISGLVDDEQVSLTGWEAYRREEILALFEAHVYGKVPDLDVRMQSKVRILDLQADGGKAVLKEVDIYLSGDGDTVSFTILMFLPSWVDGPAPMFLGLNFNGNHTTHAHPDISLPAGWLPNNEKLGISDHRARPDSRGSRASRWPVDLILSRGYGLATIYSGDLDPDFDDGFANGVHQLDHEKRDSSSWGCIAAWAWGLSRAMDYFMEDEEVDENRVAVIGHSRLGKTALWAGAVDERFAMVVSNNSGCGGAALSRRDVGESVERINRVFPHWFAGRFRSYSDNEAACPVDQHMLLALMAPRPLYVASASEDLWADPIGEYMSLFHGSKVYPLYGLDSLKSIVPPSPDDPRWAGKVAYHIRTGTHNITAWDWMQYLGFADKNMKNKTKQ